VLSFESIVVVDRLVYLGGDPLGMWESFSFL
jgi:hypothetical protein